MDARLVGRTHLFVVSRQLLSFLLSRTTRPLSPSSHHLNPNCSFTRRSVQGSSTKRLLHTTTNEAPTRRPCNHHRFSQTLSVARPFRSLYRLLLNFLPLSMSRMLEPGGRGHLLPLGQSGPPTRLLSVNVTAAGVPTALLADSLVLFAGSLFTTPGAAFLRAGTRREIAPRFRRASIPLRKDRVHAVRWLWWSKMASLKGVCGGSWERGRMRALRRYGWRGGVRWRRYDAGEWCKMEALLRCARGSKMASLLRCGRGSKMASLLRCGRRSGAVE